MVEPGDWTGPGGAQQILGRRDVDVAVLETARGGIVLRGVGYESNDASVLTNVSSDHLDLQGIHTLPELAEVKSTICRITRPDGWVVLNADDPLVAAVARRVRAGSRSSRSTAGGLAPVRRHRGGGRARLPRPRRAGWSRPTATAETEIAEVARVPITIGGLARHNVANALAAAGGARGAGRHDRPGPRRACVDFAPDAGALARPAQPVPPGRPGRHRRLRPQRGRARRRSSTWPRGSPAGPPGGPRRSPRSSGRPATGPTTRSGGSAGSPRAGPARGDQGDPQVPARADARVGRRRAAGRGPAGRHGRRPTSRSTRPRPRPCGPSSTARPPEPAAAGPTLARVIVLMCHEERDAVFELLDRPGRGRSTSPRS